jgi:hypothetical protein
MVTDLADSFWKSVRIEWQELQRGFVEEEYVRWRQGRKWSAPGKRGYKMRIPLLYLGAGAGEVRAKSPLTRLPATCAQRNFKTPEFVGMQSQSITIKPNALVQAESSTRRRAF